MRVIALLTVVLALPSLAVGQTRESLADAAARYGRELGYAMPATSQPDNAWEKVLRLDSGTRIRVVMRDGSVREGSAGSIVPTLKQADIAEVQRRTRGSWLGGILGGAAGGVLGVGIAVGIATEDQCGQSCADEKFRAGLALVGLPIAGALLGAKLMPRRAWTTIYRGR